jgi:hypothetical protein
VAAVDPIENKVWKIVAERVGFATGLRETI